jgi:hypothetical protein
MPTVHIHGYYVYRKIEETYTEPYNIAEVILLLTGLVLQLKTTPN